MFTQTWRNHWGLTEDPFACEDADKDPILPEIDAAAVHSGFDRVFGAPRVPAPAIVFGEKGSGKSGLRRMMRRRLEEHNAAHPEARMFHVEYIEFDRYFERFGRLLGAKKSQDKVADAVTKRWEIVDHLDAILSLGATELVERCLADGGDAEVIGSLPKLPRKQRADLLLFTALYHASEKRTTAQALEGLRRQLRFRSGRPAALVALCTLLTLLGVAVALLPVLGPWELGDDAPWFFGGAGLAVAGWLWRFVGAKLVEGRAARALRSLRVLPRDAAPLVRVLSLLPPAERSEYALPSGTDPANRFELLRRFLALLEGAGFRGWYVLMDRIDEPSILSGNVERMRRFVEKIFDIKLLQFEGLALKLFLPIEMETIYRGASPEELKRMRLDKSNLIPELKWSGEELYEIANQRLQACVAPDAEPVQLFDLFEEGFDFQHLRDTLTVLATPRYAFGFLSAVFLEYVRELPSQLEPEDPRWRLPRGQFDVLRAMWVDRTGVMRRSLN